MNTTIKAAVLLAASLTTALADMREIVFHSFSYTGHDATFDVPVKAGSYQNPILTGFYPDPSVCRVGDDFYLINSTFAYFPGIPIFHSRDLVNWRLLGHVISRPEQLSYKGLGVSRGIFAPAITHHDGVFYVVCTMVDGRGNFVITATDPAGPWSEPTWFEFEGIDPSLFFDDDGRAWMVNNGAPAAKPLYDGHRAIWLQQFDPKARRMIGPRTVLVDGGVDITKKPIWIEGPHLYRREGWYYLCCAEGGTGDQHSQVIFRSREITGPYVPWEQNPILTQRGLASDVPGAVTSTGHADLVIGPDGQWWAVFLGCRPYQNRFYHTGRETFLLPVEWTKDGWPRILQAGDRVPLVAKGPAGSRIAHGPPTPLTGNFTWSDRFDQEPLSPVWITLRARHKPAWQVLPGGGLALRPSADTLSGKAEPAFVARRIQHGTYETIVALDTPVDTGTSAGLVVFQGEKHHYYFGARRSGTEVILFVEQANGGPAATLATVVVGSTNQLELRVSGQNERVSFAYAVKPGFWQTIPGQFDGRLLTTEVAGGFVGAVVGMHARSEP